jgi:DNA-binding transcriptional ArsR family regulator
MADIFDVVADATRRDVLQVLLDRYIDTDSERGEISVGDIVTALGLSQPTVSKHLRTLRQADLVVVRPEAQRRWYRLNPEPLRVVDHWLEPYRAAWAGRLDDLGSHLDRMADTDDHDGGDTDD